MILCMPEELVETCVLWQYSLYKLCRRIQSRGILDESKHILQITETVVLWVEGLAEILVKVKVQVRFMEAWSIGVIDVTPE